MSQDSIYIPNTGPLSGVDLITKINQMAANVSSLAAGAVDPSTLYTVQPYTLWRDTSVSPPILRVRNASNTAWELASGYFDANFIQAGTGAVTRSSQDKMRESVSVLDFGAVGDGVADDTAAIQAAFTAAAGKTLRIHAGTHNITSEVSIPSNIRIVGDGQGVTILNFQKASNPVSSEFMLAARRQSNRNSWVSSWVRRADSCSGLSRALLTRSIRL